MEKVSSQRAWQLANRERYAFQRFVRLAVKKGRLVRTPCETCGSQEVEAFRAPGADKYAITWHCRLHNASHKALLHKDACRCGACPNIMGVGIGAVRNHFPGVDETLMRQMQVAIVRFRAADAAMCPEESIRASQDIARLLDAIETQALAYVTTGPGKNPGTGGRGPETVRYEIHGREAGMRGKGGTGASVRPHQPGLVETLMGESYELHAATIQRLAKKWYTENVPAPLPATDGWVGIDDISFD